VIPVASVFFMRQPRDESALLQLCLHKSLATIHEESGDPDKPARATTTTRATSAVDREEIPDLGMRCPSQVQEMIGGGT